MTRFVPRALWVIWGLGLLMLTLPASSVAQNGDVALAARTPRFLVRPASRGALPVEVDAARIPLLRRKVSLDLRNVRLEEALHQVVRQVDANLVYVKSVLPLDSLVRFRSDGITVAAALTELLLGLQVDVLINDARQVVLVRKGGQSAPAGSIVGRVRDTTGQALARVDVFLEGTRWRTETDSTGWYRLTSVDAGTYTLTTRRLGYAKRSQRVTVQAEREDTVHMVLDPVAVALDELVSTATGQQRRRDIGNAITTINADSVLQAAPIRNLTDLLENRVLGLTVQHTSGAPGDPSKLRLRGLGSALRSNDPVVVVDGVRIYAAQSDARNGNLTNLDPGTRDSSGTRIRANPVDVPAPSPLDQIDPNIIEKLEVFKGPSAATLYGADAANGVIVITTKRGRPGPTRWQLSLVRGRTQRSGDWPTAYFRWGHEIHTGVPRFCPLTDVKCSQDSLVQFQALNNANLTLLGRGSHTQLSLGASGGTQILTYSLTGSYGDETGYLTLPTYEIDRFRTLFNKEAPDWMRRPLHLENWNVTSNVVARLGTTADITFTALLRRSEQQRTSLEQQVAPMAGTYVDTLNGLYYEPGFTFFGSTTGNGNFYGLRTTSAILKNYYTRQTASTITFTTGLDARWHPRPWFNGAGQVGLDVISRSDQLLLPSALVTATDSGSVVRGTGRSLVGTFNLQGTFRKPLGLGFVFQTSVGANLTSTSTRDLVSSASGLVPGTTALAGATRISATEAEGNTSVYGWYIEPRIMGERISFSTGLRLDGGSNYGTQLTTASVGLPKLNASWVISEEPWFPFHTLISSLRLRGAYGQAQVQPGAADRLRLYSGTTGQVNSQLSLSNLGNTQLRPERSTEFEGGFDADVLDSRVSFDFTVYRKLQVDALMDVAIPWSVNGGGTIKTNIGNIRNTGLELSMGLTPLRSSLLTWSTQLRYSRNTNIVTKLGNGVTPNKATGLVEGYPLYSRWARPILGFADQNSDGVLQPQEIQVGDSLVYMGRLLPAYQTALSTNVQLFRNAIGIVADISYDAGASQVNQTFRTNWVLAQALVDPTVPLSEQAAVLASTRKVDPTDYGLMQEFSTFRFSSLSVRYQAPARLARLLRVERLAVAVQGSNLGLHTTYQGRDPNVNAWSPGERVVDTGQLPLPRTWQLRFDLQY